MVNLSFWSKCIVFLMKVHQNHAVFQPLFFRMTFRRGHMVQRQHLTHCHSGDAECSRRRGENGRWLRNRVQGQKEKRDTRHPDPAPQRRPHSLPPPAARGPRRAASAPPGAAGARGLLRALSPGFLPSDPNSPCWALQRDLNTDSLCTRAKLKRCRMFIGLCFTILTKQRNAGTYLWLKALPDTSPLI